MPFDQSRLMKPRIAVIGGGISGLSAAYGLSQDAQVTVFESENRIGGHARTVLAGRNGDQPVDTGFIVFNYANYPNLTRLFHDLDVPVEKSDMSFGVSVDGGRFEYALNSLDSLFAQRRNLVDPRFHKLVRDLFRFNTKAEAFATSDDMTIAELSDVMGLGKWFRDYYLLPMCGAIWSTPSQDVTAFPARTLVRFFKNHALMGASGQHQWWTVSGGSQSYVSRLVAALETRGVVLKTSNPIHRVTRDAGSVQIEGPLGQRQEFDHVIFATHADQALRMLGDANTQERSALGAVRFQDNHSVLHCDESQLPKRKSVWSSWMYSARTTGDHQGVGVSYWMNRLQNIPNDDPLFLTLNPVEGIHPSKIYDENTFRHPVFDAAALQAQKDIAKMQGQRNTWFAGAWLRNGFHEDGIATAMRIVRSFKSHGTTLQLAAE